MIHAYAQDLRQRIAESVELVREVSTQTDPQTMVRCYRDRMKTIFPRDASISISRRDLTYPYYRVTRSSTWDEDINPWKQKDLLPVLKGGLVADLIYANEPRVITDLKIDRGEPAWEYLEGMRSLLSLPLYDRGESLNMIIRLMREPNAIDPESIPDLIITSNLFGRATYNLVMAERVQQAFDALDAEFKVIAEIQRSLLPSRLPKVEGLDMAAFYATAHRAGGDYYDVFPLSDQRSAIVIADVSGHGAAAAVVMARMHAVLHAQPSVLDSPSRALSFANEQLLQRCRESDNMITFVTAFYAVYDAATRTVTYASAGHNPPRWHDVDGRICSISGARQLPLGIHCDVAFDQEQFTLRYGDELLLYTDGIIEACNPAGDMFGVDRLDHELLRPHDSAQGVVDSIVTAVDEFADGTRFPDDRTLLVLRAC